MRSRVPVAPRPRRRSVMARDPAVLIDLAIRVVSGLILVIDVLLVGVALYRHALFPLAPLAWIGLAGLFAILGRHRAVAVVIAATAVALGTLVLLSDYGVILLVPALVLAVLATRIAPRQRHDPRPRG